MKTLAITLLLLAAPLHANTGSTSWKRIGPDGRCPENHAISGDAGIASLLCLGGECAVNGLDDAGYWHRFTTEPIISSVASEGPAAGILQDGDAIVSVDGALITTREAGRRLANLTPGVPVRLRVRRGGRVLDATVVPVRGCSMPSLVVRSRGEVERTSTRRVVVGPPIDFGMQLDCGDCGWRDVGGRVAWRASDFPRVEVVEPNGPAARAGIVAGDVILRIGGHGAIDPRAGDALAELAPGESITIQLVRGGQKLDVRITARARSTR